MFHDFYQHLPLNLNPIAFSIGSFYVRWYSLSYVIGFLIASLLLLWRIRRKEYHKTISNQLSADNLLDFIILIIIATLLGGRIGYVIFYNFSYFISRPLSIISPYDQYGNFVGLFGMSYHGALISALIVTIIFCRKKSIDFFAWSDLIVPVISLGYFLGRIGNFLNGELYGRETFSPLGMYYLVDPTILRYPSQLIEAFLEGLLLFVVIWSIRNKKKFQGKLLFFYIIGYSIARIISEFFRSPDPQLGFVFGWFTMGQLLSFIVIILSSFYLFKKNKNCGIFVKN